ncbi:MAG: hypothetical protein EBY40_00190 [Marivivens sp.]|nr:hypothetical protein [Marivivens sp.]NBT50026.1 hypothetical protein [Marivivens sp.]NCW67026.1 hypothetical protein [Marivivens sp.]NDH01528.1 hypothetical protein [Marivivens sp.]
MAVKIQGEGVLKKRLSKQLAASGGALRGDKELLQKLSMLSKQSEVNRMLRPGVREAASAVRKKAKSLVVEETGLLKKSIGSKSLTIAGKAVVAIVGPRRGMGATVERTAPSGWRGSVDSDPALYAHLVEFGTVHSPPHPFMRPAWDGVNSKRIISRRTTHELRKAAQGRVGKRSASSKAGGAGLRKLARRAG